MSLISEQQKKNAEVKEPTIKPVKTSALPELQPAPVPQEAAPTPEAAFSAVPAPVPPQQDLPVIPGDTQQPTVELQPPAPANSPEAQAAAENVIDLTPIAPVEIQRAPEKAIPETIPLWQDVSEQLGQNAALRPEVANTTLPSFSIQNFDNSSTLNRAFESNSRAYSTYNEKAKEEYAAAQRAQEQINKPGALPNTPDATKRWYSAPLGFLGDVLFGSERARKQSEAGVVDLSNASFGRAGAGLGGQINYALNLVPSLFVGAVGEATAGAASALERIGVDKKTAEGFARNGFLQFLPETPQLSDSFKQSYRTATEQVPFIGGSVSKLLDGVTGYKPSQVLNFSFEEANKRNLLLDALAGDPLNDVNDPDGSVKYGRIYTRSQRKEGTPATDDPIGFALQLGTYLFSPGEVPGDYITSSIVGKLWNTLKPASKLAPEVAAKVVTNYPALPSSGMRAEAELAQRVEQARTATAGRQIFEPTQAPNTNPGFDLGAITEEQARRLNTGTPRLNGVIDPERSFLPSSGQIAAAESPGSLLPSNQPTSELNPPRLDAGQARLEGGAIEFVNPNANLGEPRLDYGEAYIEYPTNANLPQAANPTNVPRVYLGSNEVTRAALPPVFDPADVPAKVDSYLLPYNTPAKTALELGIGVPNLRIESPGALAVRPLEQVIETLKQADPKLLEGFDGITWQEFKQHLSTKVEDIGQFSNIGTNLTERRVEKIASYLKPETLTEQSARISQVPEPIKYLGNLSAELSRANGFDSSVRPLIEEAIKTARQFKEYNIAANLTQELKGFRGVSKFESQNKTAIEDVEQKIEQLKKLREQYSFIEDDDGVSSIVKETSAKTIEEFSQRENKRAVVTAERINKVRSINRRVEKNSSRAIANIDQAQQTKTSVNEQIARYESMVNDTIEQTLKPMLEENRAISQEALQELKRMSEQGASAEEIDRGLTTIERHNDRVEAEASKLLDLVGEIKNAAETLKGNDLFIAEAKYKQALADLKQTRFTNDILKGKYRILDDLTARPDTGSLFKTTEDDLLTAAEELAQHKLALEKPMQQLEQLFEETVDFGRKTVDDIPYDLIRRSDAKKTVENGGILKLYPGSFLDDSKAGIRMKNAWLSGDYEYLSKELKKVGYTLNEMLDVVVDRSNTFIQQANRVATWQTPAPEFLTRVDGSLFHGTALDKWTPPDNLYVNGSRGELGGGTYYTIDKTTATDYARARVGENVNPKTMDFDVNPTVAEVTPQFKYTLDARKPLDKKSLKDAFADLPPEISKPFFAKLNRKRKPVTYVQMREMLEESIVKSGVDPSEELLRQIDADVSKNLRGLGFDSVVDKESGFILSLDNTRVGLVSLENVPKPSAIESAAARYNADAFASKHYSGHLTTDANLRDSTYKVLAQTRDATDQKLSQVQDEIIGRGLKEQQTILPKIEDTSTKPQSFADAVENELTLDDICGL